MTTIQINLVQVLGGASAILAIAWAIILMISRLRKMEPTVTAIIIALLGIITTMWLIGIETPDTKYIPCADCGEWIEIRAKDNRTRRCPACQKTYVRMYDRNRKQRRSV